MPASLRKRLLSSAHEASIISRQWPCVQSRDALTAQACSTVAEDMVELVAALALAPWAQPVHFRPLSGWRTGATGAFASSYGPVPGVASPKESTAWMTRGVRYRDRRTADPPVATLSYLPRRGVLVFATIYESGPSARRHIELLLDRATRYPCCDGTYVAGGEYALAGAGPAGAYSVIVRVYFGSPPTRSMRTQAQRALGHLKLPRVRSA